MQKILKPYELIVARFEGVANIAKGLNMSYDTVYGWRRGHIPPKYFIQILSLAEAKGINLTTNELIRGGVK